MAYKISTSGMDELLGKLQKAGDAAHDIAAVGLYEGAGVVADAVSQAVRGIAQNHSGMPPADIGGCRARRKKRCLKPQRRAWRTSGMTEGA